MSSPRSMWSGNIQLGLLNVPVSIGKSWSEQKESGLRDLCECHGLPVDRTERCSAPARVSVKDVAAFLKARDLPGALGALTSRPTGKVKGVEVNGEWRRLKAAEVTKIEDATSSDTLTILSTGRLSEFPMEFGIGTYYVRYSPPKKGSTAGLAAYANFVATLQRNDRGCVVKWGSSSREKLGILHTGQKLNKNVLLLTLIPMAAEWREPGQKENAHKDVKPDKAVMEQMLELLDAVGSSFEYDAYEDEAAKLRAEAVDKVLGGEQMQDKQEGEGEQKNPGEQAADLMAQLRASMDQVQVDKKEKA
jgi:non-homologous end joining protein Ku